MASIEEKGRRLLSEGRLTLLEVDGDRIKAECRGDSAAVYDTGFSEERGEWYCSCPARSKCAHLVALQLVTVRNRKEEE